VTIPDTIQGVLMARIDRLPEEPNRLLQTAFVLGREFSPRLLQAVWDGTGATEPLLAELKRQEFLFSAPPMPCLRNCTRRSMLSALNSSPAHMASRLPRDLSPRDQ
jgi:hypothetical protein